MPCKLRWAKGNLGAADGVAAGGPALDRRPERSRIEALMSLAASRPLAGAPDMADRRYAGMAGEARCSQDLAALARYGFGQRAARQPARNSQQDWCTQGHILRHTGQIPLFIEEVARQLIDRGVLTGRCRPVCRERRTGTRWKFPRPCRASSPPVSIACPRKTRHCCNLRPWSDRAFRRICLPP